MWRWRTFFRPAPLPKSVPPKFAVPAVAIVFVSVVVTVVIRVQVVTIATRVILCAWWHLFSFCVPAKRDYGNEHWSELWERKVCGP